MSSQASHSVDLAGLARSSAMANDALMRGDIRRYNSLVRIGRDFVLMSPFGGAPSRGADHSPDRIEAMSRFFRNGALEQELVASWSDGRLAILATIERPMHVEVGGLPAQDWALRVTQVYRKAGEGWELIHRHADPLGHGISHATAAALGRGAIV